MRMLTFAVRCFKEIIRDPLNIAFGLGFPTLLLLLLSAIQANIPVPLFEIERLAPGMTLFGLSFLALFSSVLVAKDRGTALLQRLYTTPLTPWDFILGYTLPLLPLSMAQTALCYVVSAALGLKLTAEVLLSVIFTLPSALVFISLGLLCGSIFTDKQVGGICGALLTNLTAWLSGIWFDLELVGDVFKKIANALPFVHGVELQRLIVAGNLSDALPHLAVVLAWAALFTGLAVTAFLGSMKRR